MERIKRSSRNFLLILVSGLLSCSDPKPASGVTLGTFREVGNFAFTNQLGATVTRDEMNGKVWIANFMFTSCAAECLVLSSRIAELQMHFRDYEEVSFVSFSVDPQTDTPDRLREYSNRWHADSDRWHFLTGDSDKVDELVMNSFLLPVTRKPDEMGKLFSDSLLHSNRFAIVDRSGKVRAYVDGLPKSSVRSVSQVVMQLLQEPIPPSSN